MSSPIERSASAAGSSSADTSANTIGSTVAGAGSSANRSQSMSRARKSSSTSLSSLPSRFAQPAALKPASAAVQLDLSSASAQDHPSSLTATKTASPRSSIFESSQLWRSAAAKRAEKAWAIQSEKTLYADAKFKKYAALVERTLATFDSVSEWADFISFLSRLLKSFQAYPHFNVIPRKLIVSKRLAQCLNPALPSGVHQRALDVYAHIFSVIGSDGLRRDLPIWTSGLLPFFQYASTSVKPTLLSIYENHYLPLQEDLRPMGKALLLALLPGLEEETSEFFDRTLRLLDSISGSVGRPFFLQCLWLVLVTSSSTRLAAFNYLTRRMPNLNDEPHPANLIGQDVGLMVRGLAQSLEDETLLVRRNALELLVTHLRFDRPTLGKFVKPHDKVLLVRSALNVVLRRDLSLNRRLYSWLLGSDESIEAQTGYFQQHSLEFVRLALNQDFLAASTQAAPLSGDGSGPNLDTAEKQRPYKVFVSLLDKWEIGQPLTKVLVIDAFRALSSGLSGGQDDELSTTAKMLFEVVDPFLLYAQFLTAICGEFQTSSQDKATPKSPADGEGAGTPALELLCFMLKAFRVHDDESLQIHMPMVFGAVLQLVHEKLLASGSSPVDQQTLDALELLKLAISLIPPRVFVQISSDGSNSSELQKEAPSAFLDRASKFYSSGEVNAEAAARHFKGFQDSASTNALLELAAKTSTAFGERLNVDSATVTDKEAYVRMLDIFADLIRIVDASEPEDSATGTAADATKPRQPSFSLSWNMNAWAQATLPLLEKADSFALTERIVEMLISCAFFRTSGAPLNLDQSGFLQVMTAKLLSYMELARSPYHIRAVELIWATHKVTRPHHLETVLCQLLTRGTEMQQARAVQAFGTLWRLSDDRPCDELRAPLLLVFDKLRSPDLEEKHLAEAWLRANLRSYSKVVDPLFKTLLIARPVLHAQTLDVFGVTVETLHYAVPMDQNLCNHALQTLASLSKFSGQGFARAMKSSALSTEIQSHLVKQQNEPGPATYLDLLLEQCTTLLKSYPSASLEPTMAKSNSLLHSSSLDLIQNLVQRGQLDKKRLGQLETTLIDAVLIAIQSGYIERQNKLLHVLHGIMVARMPAPTRNSVLTDRQSVIGSPSATLDGRFDSLQNDASGPSRATLALKSHPHMLTMLKQGLTTHSNRPILQHWSDFILISLPLVRSSINSLLLPLNDCICKLIRQGVSQLEQAFEPGSSRPTFGAELVVQSEDVLSGIADSDFTLLINLSERILMQALGEDVAPSQPSREASAMSASDLAEAPTTQTQENGGLLGYVSNVFSADTSSPAIPSSRSVNVLDPRRQSLQNTVQTLHLLWTGTLLKLSPTDAKSLVLESLAAKVRLRCRRALEKIYRSHSAEVVESLLECWQRSRSGETKSAEAVFALLDLVAPSAQIVVTFLCDSLSARSGERAARRDANTDAGLFAFLDVYLSRMDAQDASQVWPVMIMLVKDYVAHSNSRKLHVFPVLKVLTTLGEKLCLTSALEDKRVRRELQENYVKLVDSCILIAGRSFDQSTWMRRTGGEVEEDEKADAIPGVETAGQSLIEAINEFLATRALSALRKFQVDPDKINSIVANVVYYIVTPELRARSK